MPIEITAPESADVAHSLKKYFRDEFDQEIEASRLCRDWADHVEGAYCAVKEAVIISLAETGPNLDTRRTDHAGVPDFILRA